MMLWRALTPLILKAVDPRSRAVDVGCGIRPFDTVLRRRGYRPVGVDATWDTADCLAAIPHLPFRDDTFPLTLCINVLQYVSDPVEACRELRRITRAEGTVLIAVPSFYPVDSDDKWRWTEHAARTLLRDTGFESVSTVPIGGTVSILFHLLALSTRKAVPIMGRVIASVFDSVAVAGLRSKNTALTGGYAVSAIKPVAAGRR
jgi:SAM-dependent methyltransferase